MEVDEGGVKEGGVQTVEAGSEANGLGEKKEGKVGKEEEEDDDVEEDEDGDDEDEDGNSDGKGKKKKKKHKRKKKKKSKKNKKRKRDEMEEEPKPKRQVKTGKPTSVLEMPRLKQLEAAMQAYRWWEHEHDGEIKWTKLEHNGLRFPPKYEPHGVPLIYDGEEIELSPEEEELAMFFAEIPVEGPNLNNEKTAKVFTKNFFQDFREGLQGKNKEKIVSFDKCDFTKLRLLVQERREKNKNMTKEEKEARKRREDELKLHNSFAVVDGNLQKVGNTMIEPPGLFRGRGAHPKTGMVKQRVRPGEVLINCGPDDPVPDYPLEGHNWKAIVHKPEVTWLAMWKENIMGNTKYMQLAASSSFKGVADRDKYEKARELKRRVKAIRKDYEQKLKTKGKSELFDRQLGTAVWVIDRLALRIGNEKEDDEAETFGCCSLLVDHVTVDKEENTFTLDFPGKDSMRHFQTYTMDDERYEGTGKMVLENFLEFIDGKDDNEQVFEKLTVSDINDYLKTQMKGLSAKVFRTMNASVTLEEQLPSDIDLYMPDAEKGLAYNEANREVAILCNHQRTVTKSQEDSIVKSRSALEQLELQAKELKDMHKRLKKGKELKKLKPELDKDATPEEKRAVSHLFSRQPRTEDVKKRLDMWHKKIMMAQTRLRDKDENKAVALGTSKINYCDPRITVAWCKRVELPIEKVFPATLRDKFPWAMSAPETYRFVDK